MATIVYSRSTVRESSHISFFCGGDPFCATAREHTQEADRSALSDQWVSFFAWETSGPLPFIWVTAGSLPSVQIYRPYIVFSSPMREYEPPLSLMYFSVCGWLSELTYFWGVFSGNLLILSTNGNICHSIPRQ